MSRVFLMKWYHFSVEYFEDLRNVNHCEFLIMRRNEESGKYILQNKLRTWSELKRERAALAAKEKAEKGGGDEAATAGGKGKENGNSKDSSMLQRALSSHALANTSAPVETRRRWGGCPNGCNHDKSFKIRQTLADLVKSDSIISDGNAKSGTASENGSGASSSGTVTNGNAANTPNPNNDSSSVSHTHGVVNPSFNGTANSHTVTSSSSQASTIVSRRPAAKRFQSQTDDAKTPELVVVAGPQIDVTKAHEEIVSSPDGTPSFISVDDRLRNHLKSPIDDHHHLQLHVGRDFGGTYSGHNSVVASDADSSEDDRHRRRVAKLTSQNNGGSAAIGKTGLVPVSLPLFKGRNQSRMGRNTRANRLGDHPHSSDGEHEADCEHEHDYDHDNEHSPGEEEDGADLSRTLTDQADEAILKKTEMEEREDRSIQGSVY